MKRSYWIGLVAVIVLGAGAYYALYLKNQSSTLNIKDSAFQIPDTASVTKIFLASKFGWSTTLEKINGIWYINNQKASSGMVRMLLRTMHLQRIKRPVYSGERNMVIKTIATKGTKVEVYAGDDLIKTFFVGGNTNDSEGTYFIMEGSENPFVVYMPGLRGFLNSRYRVKEDDFRDTQLFGSSASSLKSVSVEYPKQPDQSFIIENSGSGMTLFGPEDYDPLKVENYVLVLQKVHIVNILNMENDGVIKLYDSLSQLVPDARIKVEDQRPAYSNSINIYFNPEDPDGGYGIATFAGDEKFVTYQDYVFRNVLVPSDFFLKEEG